MQNRILIIDDAPANIKLLGQALKDRYVVVVANNGQSGLKIAQSEPPPDLILLDVMMPEMDGYEVCAHLKNNPDTAAIPVIFLTANDAPGEEDKGLRLGAVDFITKPFSIPLVLSRVEAHMRNYLLSSLFIKLQNAASDERDHLLSQSNLTL
jgi:putative two-component system response regulator